MIARVLLLGVSVSILGCGGGRAKPAPATAEAVAPPAAAKQSAESDEPKPEAAEAEAGAPLPTECAKPGAEVCTPSRAFADRLCKGNFPSVALVLFKKGSPWARGYMTRKTKAWNASGGASDSDELEFDEEVLVLRHRAVPAGGIQVSGAGGGFDALRWNGSCVTLAKEELTLRNPPKAKHSKVEWRWLDDKIQEALRNDPKVDAAYKERRNECKGATMGTVSLKCVKADAKLSDAIVNYVRDGGSVPVPEKLP